MLTNSSYIMRTAFVAVTISALLISLCPVALQAQEALAVGDATKKVKGLDDPDFVGKWDFEKAGQFGSWKPLQAAGTFEAREGVIYVNANSQRPCLDLAGPYSAEQISLIEIRIRGIAADRDTPSGTDSAMGGANDRVRRLPALYQGTRLYFTRAAKEKYDAANSFEIPLPLDGEFHILTINPHELPSWKGQLKKIRLDIGDFPNHYELDYIYFHRAEIGAKKNTSQGDKAKTRAGAASLGARK